MDWTLLVVLQVLFQPCLSVLFTVEAERTVYNSEFGQDVVMGCRFQPKPSSPDSELKVTWHLVSTSPAQEVYQYQWDDRPAPPRQDNSRVKLLTNELREGWAKLQISSLRINDSGTYQCLVQTREGADYKTITLSVTAPYTVVTRSVERAAAGDKALLSCQSEGFPDTSVAWQDGRLRAISANTSAVKTRDHLFRVTSQILVSASDQNNYTCGFANGGHSATATFYIPDDLPAAPVKRAAAIAVLSVALVMALVAAAAVLLYRRRKGFQTLGKRNPLVDGRVRPVAVEVNKEKEEERMMFTEDYRRENLRVFLKERYCKFQCDADVEELHHRLQNNEGHPVGLQALIPEAGESVFLGGAPGSGKTSVAYALVSSWTAGPTHALSNFLDLTSLQLLLYLDCSAAEDDLFQEAATQLSLGETISTENELRTMLGSSGTLLLLDGYREGNVRLDESIRTLLREPGGCRLLVVSSQEHGLLPTGTARTARALKLQTKTAKY